MGSERSQRSIQTSVRLFAGFMALPGLLVGLICVGGCVHHASYQLVEWAAISLAMGFFFAFIAIRGRNL